MIYRRESPPPARTVTVPRHREIKEPTLRTIIRRAGLTPDEFLPLL